MYYPNYIGKDWVDSISGRPVNPMANQQQTPVPAVTAPKEPTIMELLEQNWQKQEEKERQQSMLPDNFGSSYFGQGMSRTAMPANSAGWNYRQAENKPSQPTLPENQMPVKDRQEESGAGLQTAYGSQPTYRSQPAFGSPVPAAPQANPYAGMGIYEQINARINDWKKEQEIEQRQTPWPANYNQPAQVAAEQPDTWLTSYLPQGKSTPLPQNLNMTAVNTPANTSPIPPFIENYAKTLPQQKSVEFNQETLRNKYNELNYMTNISHNYSENPAIDKLIQLFLRNLGEKAQHPLIKYPLKYNKQVYQSMSKIGAEAAYREKTLEESGYKK